MQKGEMTPYVVSVPARLVLGTLARLGDGGRPPRCEQLKQLLECLGFNVRDGRRGGHKLVTHAGLGEFLSASYNCGHGRNPEIRPAYLRNLRKIIESYERELIEFLETRSRT